MIYMETFIEHQLRYIKSNLLPIAFVKCIQLLHFIKSHIPFLVLYSLGIYSLFMNYSVKQHCYFHTVNTFNEPENGTIQLLEDILSAKSGPKLGKSIFFIETSCKTNKQYDGYFLKLFQHRPTQRSFKVVSFNLQQACAVESAALHNSDNDIFILFAAPTYLSLKNTTSYLRAVLSYKNVRLHNIDLLNFTKATPIDKWFRKGEIFKSSFPVENLSDFLRFLTLWRWGGTYLDMDVLSLKPLANLSSNFIGAESNEHLNTAVMNLAADGSGHRIATLCLEEFQKHFRPDEWGYNGPKLVTRILKQLCELENVRDMIGSSHCLGMKIFPRNVFYPVPYENWAMFFNPYYMNASFELMKNSIVAHLWNHMSKNIWNGKTPSGSFKVMAENNCPRVYELFNRKL